MGKIINRTCVWEKSTSTSRICSLHIKQEDFQNYIQVSLGGAKCLTLKHDAIPSVYPEGTCNSQALQSFDKDRPAARKREVTRVRTTLIL